MIKYSYDKNFTLKQLTDLFNSVGWYEDTEMPESLFKGINNSTNIVCCYEEDKLIGIIRSMDDGFWSATIDCLVVHYNYQGIGIGSNLIKKLLVLLENIKYISVSPNDCKNNSFYQKFGFEIIPNTDLLQLELK